MSSICPHALLITLFDDYLKVHTINITIDSEHAFLYESIMSLIQVIAGQALEALHREINMQIVNALNDGFDRKRGAESINRSSRIG